MLYGIHRRPFSHFRLKPFKKDINNALSDYLEAVESSTETAQHGVTFSTNIRHLLETLRDPQLYDSDRNQFMEEVKQIGARALESAQQTCDAFDYIQRSLFEVCLLEIFVVASPIDSLDRLFKR